MNPLSGFPSNRVRPRLHGHVRDPEDVTARYPIGEVVFFRSAFALIPPLGWLVWQRDLINSVPNEEPRRPFQAGIHRHVADVSEFYGALLPAAPGCHRDRLCVAPHRSGARGLVLKEKVRAYRWTAVGIGFVGVLIMLSPYLSPGCSPAASHPDRRSAPLRRWPAHTAPPEP